MRKLNFKFGNLLHMYKGYIFIGKLMNNVSIGLGNDHVDFRYFQAVIIAHVSPAIPETYGPLSVAQSPAHSEHGNWLRPVAMETTSRRATANVICLRYFNNIATDSFV